MPVISALLWVTSLAHAAGGAMNFEEATTLLRDPDRFCEAAAALAGAGEARGLVPLMSAYDSRAEGGKICLLDAMEALDAKGQAAKLAENPATANVAYRMMGLFPDDRHLPVLVAAIDTADARGRFTAIRALGTQLQTEAWEATMVRLLDHARTDARAAAIDALSTRNTDVSRAALTSRRDREDDPKLKAKLETVAP